MMLKSPAYYPDIEGVTTRAYGADIVLYGDNYDEACEAACAQSAQRNVTFVHPFDDDVIAGQGTLGLEILMQNPPLDMIVLSVSGGGLIGGIGCALKGRSPHVEVVGIQTSRLPSMKAAAESDGQVNLADVIAVRRAGTRMLPLVQKDVDQIVTVDEDEITMAIVMA